MTFGSLAAGCLLVLAATTAAAQTGPPLISLDTTDLALVEPRATDVNAEFRIPARFGAPDVKIVGVSTIQAGSALNPDAARLVLQGPPAARGFLLATFDLTKLSAAGPYVTTIVLSGTPQSGALTSSVLAAPPGKAKVPAGASIRDARASPVEQVVQLKLTKPAAELRLAQPIQVERVVYVPCFLDLPCFSTTSPTRFILIETQGKSWLRILPTRWIVALRKGDRAEEQGRLVAALPASIDGWGQGEVSIAIDGPLSLGTSTGALTVRAPQLAAQTVDFQVQVVNRVSTLWILVVISAGIGLSAWVRGRLEKGRALTAAKIDAETERGRLDDALEKTADPEFNQRLGQLRDDLGEVIDADASTADAIAHATAAAADGRSQVFKQMDDRRNALRASLGRWQIILASDYLLPTRVSEAAEELATLLVELPRMLDAGLFGAVSEALDAKAPSLSRALGEEIKRWLEEVAGLQDAKPWPETHLPEAIQSVLADAGKLGALAVPTAPDQLSRVLLDTDALHRKLRAVVFHLGVGQVVELAGDVVAGLEELRAGPETLKRVGAALGDVTAQQDQLFLENAASLVRELNLLWEALRTAVLELWGDPSQPPAGLAEGRFVEALDAVRMKRVPKETRLGGGAEGPVRAGRQFERPDLAVPEGRVAPWAITLEAGRGIVGQALAVVVHLVVPPGAAEPVLTIRWLRNGRFFAEGAPGELARRFTFYRPGPAEIQVVARDRAGRQTTASITVVVTVAQGAAAVAGLRRELARVEGIQWFVSALIIAGAGWIIFAPSFVGNAAEFFAGFLWGFTVDIGVAQVLDLGASLKGLKPTLAPRAQP